VRVVFGRRPDRHSGLADLLGTAVTGRADRLEAVRRPASLCGSGPDLRKIKRRNSPDVSESVLVGSGGPVPDARNTSVVGGYLPGFRPVSREPEEWPADGARRRDIKGRAAL